MRRSNLDIFLATLLAALTIALVFLHIKPGGVLVLFGFLLVFILPGYTLSVALFPAYSWSTMERIVFTLGLSLVLPILGGIIFYYLSIPLQGETWVLFLGLVVFATGALAIVRRSRLAKVPTRRGSDTIPVVYKFIYPTPGQFLIFGLSAVIILGAIIYARGVAATQPATEIVQLWILPGNSTNVPSVEIGVFSNEFAPHKFSLWLERDGYTIQSWPQLVLEPGKKWQVTVPLDTNLPGTGPLEVYLYLQGQPNLPYRHVMLWPDQLINK
jgi:uncharacterized membrane protein